MVRLWLTLTGWMPELTLELFRLRAERWLFVLFAAIERMVNDYPSVGTVVPFDRISPGPAYAVVEGVLYEVAYGHDVVFVTRHRVPLVYLRVVPCVASVV